MNWSLLENEWVQVLSHSANEYCSVKNPTSRLGQMLKDGVPREIAFNREVALNKSFDPEMTADMNTAATEHDNCELMKQNKELKEELEIQEQRIAELEYKNEAHLCITRLMMETTLTEIRDGKDVEDIFPLPDFDLYKCMVGEILEGEEKKIPDNSPWVFPKEYGSSTKEFLLDVWRRHAYSCWLQEQTCKKLKLQENNII